MAAKKTAAKKTAAKKTAVKKSPTPTTVLEGDDTTWTPLGNEVGIRVRMYRVGFGDFFLVTCLQDLEAPVHIIIDCGVFKGTSGTGDLGSIDAAVANMAALTQGKVALIMVTHRHADHIAGFARCAPIFKSLSVEAIWMSIWESQYPAITQYQAKASRRAAELQAKFASLAAASTEENTAHGFMANAVGEGGGNAAALKLLNDGISGVTPAYYQAGQDPTLPASFVRAGITAKILGPPPIADVPLMQLMDLQKGIGQYMTAVSAMDEEASAPFGPDWVVDAGQAYVPKSFDEWRAAGERRADKSLAATPGGARKLMEAALRDAQPDAALAAASQLNSFLNNQSLVVLFTFKEKNLLFVGDAQAGNWQHWLFGVDTPDKSATRPLSPDAQKILTSLDFYKVGHHGSGNATPKTVVNTMSKGSRKFAAMCSTEKGVYGKENPQDPSAGTEVPRMPLLSALAGVATVVRSDQSAISVGGKTLAAAVDAALPAPGGGARFAAGPLWIDCYL
jgi:hypothetical protein